jgi:hypothetical protein
MFSAVSVLDGQLTRTWKYPINGKLHIVNLYHDTITGVRSVAVNYEEVRGSMGNSSLMMESTGHTIWFDVPHGGATRGHITINRSGTCVCVFPSYIHKCMYGSTLIILCDIYS